ncbi:GPCR fungal pheromone mating factor [Suillus bovinus]|uniref:GPCR fungal pheromone mating factor n=1 Tax=Suillus bovinus TaxID=48563 RepID=UPI001B86F57C|nr:GPCR fungal pheromone mating factor [Suillus bovinus]KAG2133677.1 GPCR fungal pheromone mating factor [Suillus bovinus]
MHPEFTPVSFLAALSLLLPLPSQWRARNVATLSIIAWLFVLNFVYGVDAIIWSNNVNIVVPGSTFALPAACLCICIHIEHVASLFELFMCFGLQMVSMGLHYIVQGHRFDIIEGYGCRPATYVSIPAIFLIWLPPLVLSVISLGRFFRPFHCDVGLNSHVTSKQSRNGLTTFRYFRLMLMAIVEMIWNIMVASYILWFVAKDVRPWTNWDDVHWDFSRIDLYPAAFMPKIALTNYYLVWWVVPASTLIFVAFFAFGKDAVNEYTACMMWMRRNVLKRTNERTAPSSVPLTEYVICSQH